MIRFLIERPIAVLMEFAACFIIGLATYFALPVSLLPDIAIPQITIHLTADNVVRRRIEQLPEVAMADITGVPGRMLQIVPDRQKMNSLGLTVSDLEQALAENNVEPGHMLVRDGYYEYNIRIASLLRTPEDVEDIYLRKGDRILQLKDLCTVRLVSRHEQGRSMAEGKRAVTLAIIKQSDDNMDNLKRELRQTLDYFAALYPDIDFTISRDQTELLYYTIGNLQQNFALGFLFIFIVSVVFIGDMRSPLVIGITMIASVVITFFLFYLCHVSVNVISLSGLILAVGMMIDNAIIVTENIQQYRDKGWTLKRAAVAGTSEMITPMLSSSLTTIAVFVPLVFMSGIAGAIFMDQAFSITAGLLVSYFTGIMLLPVLYFLIYRIGIRKAASRQRGDKSRMSGKLERLYDKGMDWVFSHKAITLTLGLLTLPLCILMFLEMEKERMPKIDQNELVTRLEWNENIHLAENNRRVSDLLKAVDDAVTEHTAYVGMQDYVLNPDQELTATEAELYFKTESPEEIRPLQQRLDSLLSCRFPTANVTFSPPVTIFEKLFATGEADVVARLSSTDKAVAPQLQTLRDLEAHIAHSTGLRPEPTAFRSQLNLVIDRERLQLYRVSYETVARELRIAFKSEPVSTLRSYQQYLPITIADGSKSVEQVLNETLVESRLNTNDEKALVPLSRLVSVIPTEDLKSITAGRNGEHIPLDFYDVKDAPGLVERIRQAVRDCKGWDVSFSGSFFSNQQMMDELVIILLVSVLLMYFILCAQFESFVQPLIVLCEIPMDTAFALVLLQLCGQTLNLMSAIGIIVACGIVVNDSILKLDSINELRRTGMPLVEAIHTAGRRRLRAIVMTTLTTVFAMIPLLFTSDLGSELQRPLSIAMIGTMLVGLFISLFFIPLVYWFIYRRHE